MAAGDGGGSVVSLFGGERIGISLRQPPANLQAEQALLGACLATSKAFRAVEGFLRPEHFADPIHARIFEAMQRRVAAGGIADVITLRGEFEHSGVLDDVGGISYLASLLASMVGVITAGQYGRAVREAWERRRMIEAGEALIDRAYDGGHSASLARGELRAALDRMDGDRVGGAGQAVSLVEAVDRALAAADRAARLGGVVGISTGMPSVDAVLLGLEPGTLTVVAGRPGAGKSSMGHQWALAAARAGVSVAEFSLEMSATAVGRRTLAIASGVPIKRLREGTHGEDVDRLLQARKELRELPLRIFDGHRYSPGEVSTSCRRLASKEGLGLILVDHLNLMPPDGGAGRHGPTAATTEVVHALLGVTKQTGAAMILLVQLNRGSLGREDHRPNQGDLRQSGAIEEDADNICFVHRPELFLSKAAPSRDAGEPASTYDARVAGYQDGRARLAGVAELIVDKVRDGDPGVVPMRFHGPTASFEETGNGGAPLV